MRNGWVAASLPALLLSAVVWAQQVDQRQEEAADYFKSWLRQDVLYIITPEEADVFLKLTTDEERESFIEQFWFRRDPNPATSVNEYKEEHYRRIAYVNENFGSGIPGWKTDRGMIYIKFGEPDYIESNPTGGDYRRPNWEGGGSTTTYPFERWEYRYLEGVGGDVEIEFVDDTLSGEYRMTTNPHDKDALLYIPNAGLTDAEMLGLVQQKLDRIVPKTSPMPGSNPLLYGYGRAKDQPFEKLQLVTNLQRAPAIDFSDFKTEVLARVRYDDLPVTARSDLFRLGEQGRVLVTVYLAGRELTFRPLGDAFQGELQVYGVVKNLTGRIVEEFEDTLQRQISDVDYPRGFDEDLIYQKQITVAPGRYKLQLYVKDTVSDKIGSEEQLIHVARPEPGRLALSSVIVARRIETIPAAEAEGPNRFKVWPVTGGPLPVDQRRLGFYYEIYNFEVDQQTDKPALDLKYELRSAEGRVMDARAVFHSPEQAPGRMMILSILEVPELTRGRYQLKIRVHDRISGRQAEAVLDVGRAPAANPQ